MVSINYATREVTCKIVYYGPGLSGKTTNLIYIHKKVPANTKGKMISLATEADRTLYFDFLPINIGTISGFAAKFQLYTVPGQVYYNATRKLVLRGVDGLVFVADSQADKMDENIESLTNMRENIEEYGYNLDEIPVVIQYNKRDLPNVLSVPELDAKLNTKGWASFGAEAVNGAGVFDSLKMIIKLVLEKAKQGQKSKPKAEKKASPTPVAKPEPIAEKPMASTPSTGAARESVPEPQPVVSGSAETAGSRVAPKVKEHVKTAAEAAAPTGQIRSPAYDREGSGGEPDKKEPVSSSDVPPMNKDIVSTTDDINQIPSDVKEDARGAEVGQETARVTSAQARPFPGSRRERRITVSDFLPSSREDGMEEIDEGSETDNVKKETAAESNLPSPTMAPSSRLIKKKRGFFKRLFGIK